MAKQSTISFQIGVLQILELLAQRIQVALYAVPHIYITRALTALIVFVVSCLLFRAGGVQDTEPMKIPHTDLTLPPWLPPGILFAATALALTCIP